MSKAKVTALSNPYGYALRQLTQAAGYDKSADALGRLASTSNEQFFPEESIREFLDRDEALPDNDDDKKKVRGAIRDICISSIFSDGGVDAYAAPTAPLIFGLSELAAKAAGHNTAYVLISADISNLGGLNRQMNRTDADMILRHLARIPEDAAKEWAAANHYGLQQFAVRTGGDEFRYIVRLQSDHPIDPVALKEQLAALGKTLHTQAEQFARDTAIDCIAHTKPERQPGVGIAAALQPIAADGPGIQQILEDMNIEISEARRLRRPPSFPSLPSDSGPSTIHVPSEPPSPGRVVQPENPFRQLHGCHPMPNETYEDFTLRCALQLAGLESSVERMAYELKTRRSFPHHINDENHREVVAVMAANNMRGIRDPVSGCYSASCRDDMIEYYRAQGREQAITMDLCNLSGLNKVSESFANGILASVGQILESAYTKHCDNLHGKPPIIRDSGGRFTVILPKGWTTQTKEKFIHAFAEEIHKKINVINNSTIESLGRNYKKDIANYESIKTMKISELPGRDGQYGISISEPDYREDRRGQEKN